jgi:hypothetical protein
MQPLYEVTVSRPSHWSIAIVSEPGAAVPDALDDSLVTAASEALAIKVRHAQEAHHHPMTPTSDAESGV